MTESPADDLARHYDELPLWSALAGRLLLERVPLPSAGRVLDIGCGTGFPALEIAARCGLGVEVVGVDLWQAALAQAETKALAWGCGSATFVCADAADLPLPDGAFDLVVSCLGVNNFSDPGRSLAEARRVMAPKARLALVTNLRGQFRSLYDALAAIARDRRDAGAVARVEAEEAGRVTREGLVGLAFDAGLEVCTLATRDETLRFASIAAMLDHHFMRLAFVDAWRSVFPDLSAEEFGLELADHLPVGPDGSVSLEIPLLYAEFRLT